MFQVWCPDCPSRTENTRGPDEAQVMGPFKWEWQAETEKEIHHARTGCDMEDMEIVEVDR